MNIIRITKIDNNFRKFYTYAKYLRISKIYDKADPEIEKVIKYLKGVDEDIDVYFLPKMDIDHIAHTIIETTDSSGWYKVPAHKVTYGGRTYTEDGKIKLTYKNFEFYIRYYCEDIYVEYKSIFTDKHNFFHANNGEEVIEFLKHKTHAKKYVTKKKKPNKEVTHLKTLITRKTNDIERMKKQIEDLQNMINKNEQELPELMKKLDEITI